MQSSVTATPASALATTEPAQGPEVVTTSSLADETQTSARKYVSYDLIRPPEAASQESPTLSKLPPNGRASQVPHAAFRIKYERFRGSVDDFIRAIICVDDLRKKKALPEFLYDDFIRAFCEEYIQYISETAGHPGEQPLTAIKWYNDNVERPRYLEGVITKENIESVLERYQAEVQAIKGSIDSQKEGELREPAHGEDQASPSLTRSSSTRVRAPSWYAQHPATGELLSGPYFDGKPVPADAESGLTAYLTP